MKTVSSAVQTLLESGSFFSVDIYTIVTANGPTIRLAEADFDVVVGSNTWVSTGPYVSTADNRQTAHWKAGLDVDSWAMTIIPRSSDPITGTAFPDKIGSVPWMQAAANGALDGALVTIERAYYAAPPLWDSFPNFDVFAVTDVFVPVNVFGGEYQAVGSITIFYGMVAEVDITATKCIVTVNDMRQLLTTNMPRNLYQSNCRHQLFDARCTLSRSTYTQSATAGASSTRSTVVASAAVAAPGGSNTYVLGRLTFTSGLNSGFSRTVSSVSGTSFKLFNPLPYAPSAGDSFSVSAGCNKQFATCQLFSNTLNFGGFPYIPAPETSL